MATPGTENTALRDWARPFIAAVAFLLLFLSAAGLFLMIPAARQGRVDFRHLYTAGYMVRTGQGGELYDYARYEALQQELVGPAHGALPFNHMAYETLLFVPLTAFPYKTAYLVFLAFNLLLLAATVIGLQQFLSPLRAFWRPLPVALVVCFLPIALALMDGQDSLVLLALFVGATWAMESGRELTAGALTGLTLFKFQYALPIALLFLMWRRWRFLAGFAVCGCVVVAISVWLAGVSGTGAYLRSLAGMSTGFSVSNRDLYQIRPEGMPNLRGLAYVLTGGSAGPMHLIVVGASLLVLGWSALKLPSLPEALLAALLVSYHQVISDHSLLILPLAMVLSGCARADRARRPLLAAVALAAFVGPTVMLFGGARFYLLAVPSLSMFCLWNGTYPSPNLPG